MTFARYALSFSLALSLAVGCGDDDAAPDGGGGGDAGGQDTGIADAGPQDSGGTDAGGTDAGEADAGTVPGGDCEGPADCDGRGCVAITPGGWRVCTTDVVEVTECSGAGVGVDACACDDAPICEGGVACVRGPLTLFCGGIAPQETNVCAIDECSDDAACGDNAICLPGPVLGRQVRSCVPAPCRTNADCTDGIGGVCAPVPDPCCGVRNLTCVYDGGCFDSGSCGDGEVCVAGVCGDQPPCPA